MINPFLLPPYQYNPRLSSGNKFCHVFMGSSVQFRHSVISDSLQPHGLQHTRLPCPSPTPEAYSNSCPLSWWYHPTISSSAVSFSSRLQSFPASGSFQMSQFLTSGGQSIGVSASASVLPMNGKLSPTQFQSNANLSTLYPKFGLKVVIQPSSGQKDVRRAVWSLEKAMSFSTGSAPTSYVSLLPLEVVMLGKRPRLATASEHL